MARRLARLVLGGLGLFALMGAASAVVSPPGAGRPIAAALGVPWRAVVAHRGASAHAPEETVVAYRLAAALGADYLELDLQRSADGVLLAFHDDTLERTTDVATRFPGREKEMLNNFSWSELETLDAGSWFNKAHPERARPEFVGAKIARLDDVLDVMLNAGEDWPGVYIETKAAERFPGIEEQLVAALRARGLIPAATGGPAFVIFQSFVPESLERLQRLAPTVPRVLLVSSDMVSAQGMPALIARAVALDAGLGPVGYHAMPWEVGAAHRAGRLVHPYTIDRPWQMRLASFFGADGLFTNECGLMLELEGRGRGQSPAQILDRLREESAKMPPG